MSRWLSEFYPSAMVRGFKETTSRYGALLDYMDVAIVEGFVYLCPRPVAAPKTAKGPPPKLVFKILSLLHPQIRKRIRQSELVFASKLWREDVARWDNEWLPEIKATNDALQAIEPAELDQAGLVAHLGACRVALDHAIYRHHSLNLCCMLPTGDLLVHAAQWTKLPVRDLLRLLSGASKVSIGAASELSLIATAIENDPESASALAASASAPATLAALQRLPSSVAHAMEAYLAVVGHRILSGYDVADLTALEVPEALVNAIRSTVFIRRSRASAGDDIVAETARVRELVPLAHREQFDGLLNEARLTYRIRDERAYSNDSRTLGLARRALLEAGRRLVKAGRRRYRVDHHDADV